MRSLSVALAATCLLCSSVLPSRGEVADWPQFRGPNRDGICGETGLLKQWPEGGPKLLWSQEGMGRGYASLAIVSGKLYIMGDLDGQDGKAQFVQSFDLATRKRLWATRIGPHNSEGDQNSAGGPRCTPTVDGDRLYVVGTKGDLVCLETAGGKLVWQKNFEADFGGRMMSMWKFSESPLVDGDKVVCTPGGKEATIVALDKKTGNTLWKCAVPELGSRGKDGAGYTSMVAADIAGVRQYVQVLGRGAVGVAAADGRFLWGYNRVANGVANITSPVVRGDHVFVTTSYETGAALLKISRDGDGMKADEVYFLDGRKVFENHHGGVLLIGDHIYGGSGRKKGIPVCLEMLTGNIAWKADAPAQGSAAALYADGHIILRYESGPVYLIEASPKEFKVQGSFTPPVNDGPAWSHPVIHDGKLYLRSHDVLMCYDIKG